MSNPSSQLAAGPSSSGLLPAKSWQHFVAGGYVPSISVQANSVADCWVIGYMQPWWDVRCNRDKPLRRRKNPVTVRLIQGKARYDRNIRQRCSCRTQTSQSSVALCGNGAHPTVKSLLSPFIIISLRFLKHDLSKIAIFTEKSPQEPSSKALAQPS